MRREKVELVFGILFLSKIVQLELPNAEALVLAVVKWLVLHASPMNNNVVIFILLAFHF